MNRIEIKADGPVDIQVVEGHAAIDGVDCYAPQPDRITITLTEREASLLGGLMHGGSKTNGHRGSLFDGLNSNCTVFMPEAFDWSCFDKEQDYGNPGYAHAQRMDLLTDPPQKRIALTMDRDVAVTLYHLLMRLDELRELRFVYDKLRASLPPIEGNALARAARFTGTIRWKKRRLHPADLSEGRVYKLVKRHRHDPTRDEWEPVEE